ncbi:hypothetical protein RAM19_02810 [Bartonella apihabitans]|nr:hypothetical protein [Bartonella apihabitans]WLT09167.1 hypothetical protein RAM19_02810 [Bartonella apihabitans]
MDIGVSINISENPSAKNARKLKCAKAEEIQKQKGKRVIGPNLALFFLEVHGNAGIWQFGCIKTGHK